MRPSPNDYGSFYAGYVSNVGEDDILGVFESQSGETQRLLARLDEARASYRYESGKWSVKEVIGHFTDTERVMSYRALAFGRGETQPLPGFDERVYVEHAEFDRWRIGDLAEQYALVRRASILLFSNLPESAWENRGVASGAPVTVRALAYIIVGHERHHLNVLRERYNVE